MLTLDEIAQQLRKETTTLKRINLLNKLAKERIKLIKKNYYIENNEDAFLSEYALLVLALDELVIKYKLKIDGSPELEAQVQSPASPVEEPEVVEEDKKNDSVNFVHPSLVTSSKTIKEGPSLTFAFEKLKLQEQEKSKQEKGKVEKKPNPNPIQKPNLPNITPKTEIR